MELNQSSNFAMKEILKLTPEQGREIVYEDTDDFKTIQYSVINVSRWSLINEIIVQRLSDDKFFKSSFSVGTTELQDERPYEYSEAIFEEVLPVEKTIIVYE